MDLLNELTNSAAKNKVITIPEGSSIVLSEEVYMFMLMQVPRGRLTRDKDIEAYLARRFGVHHIKEFDRKPISFRELQYDCKYVEQFRKYVPEHRKVSAIGHLEGDSEQPYKLAAEGFVLENKGPYHKAAVKDYKKYLFDFDKETDISLETLKDVDKNGLMKYFNLAQGEE